MKCTLDRVEYELQDSGTLDTEVQVTCEEDGIDQVVTLSHGAATAYREPDGSFTQQGFEEMCSDEVVLGIDWDRDAV